MCGDPVCEEKALEDTDEQDKSPLGPYEPEHAVGKTNFTQSPVCFFNVDAQGLFILQCDQISFFNGFKCLANGMEWCQKTSPTNTPLLFLGVNYIIPVTGFFCKLCNVFYSDETKANSEHCKSLEHYNNLKVEVLLQ